MQIFYGKNNPLSMPKFLEIGKIVSSGFYSSRLTFLDIKSNLFCLQFQLFGCYNFDHIFFGGGRGLFLVNVSLIFLALRKGIETSVC